MLEIINNGMDEFDREILNNPEQYPELYRILKQKIQHKGEEYGKKKSLHYKE